MKFNSDIHHRQSIRLKAYDYSQEGAYFVTICVRDRECLLGEIKEGKMILNELGKLVLTTWHDLPKHNSGIELDAWVVMPNHIHAIIMIVGAGSKPVQINCESDIVGAGSKPAQTNHESDIKRAGLEPAPTGVKLSEIVRQLKTFSARRINKLRKTPGLPIWQRNYHEHVIRNEDSLNRIREYIQNNPLQWELDPENPLAGIVGGGFQTCPNKL